MKKIITGVILLVYLILIFAFSHQESDNSTDLTLDVVNTFVTSENKIEEEDITVFKLIRKSAHVALYFGLGVITYLFVNNFKLKNSIKYLFIVGFGVLYAISDEMHQMFIPGRSGQITDVLLDSLGVILAAFCLYGYERMKINANNKKVSL